MGLSHPAVRQQLLPSVSPTVLPVVCYTGSWSGPADQLIGNDPDRYPQRTDNDTYRADVADNAVFSTLYNSLDATTAKMSWIYMRLPKEGGEDPLWKPERSLGQAREIPSEV